ncbi:DNA polymerase III subunit delta' [Methylocystis bryophila]|uniref:DNA polymerase III subunit delta n=1 Tax=Methylocystis bryophila TaxID=655015 RepID=A0A1W6N024_9HYPH|nr:DNA polymerase III subunit delta' [Methylocystis bryophila]ARN83181.1 DNA polymerase III subunit delta' [Methylocystis bryophila]BDV39518.1 DNA polymerase III subunit delta' [Methylocystis bryophila]
MSRDAAGPPESDRFPGAPHPRENLSFFGHPAAERSLLDAYRRDRLAQAFILGGPEGVGKATLAWRFTRFLQAHPDPKAAAVQEASSLFVPPEAPAARRMAAQALPDVFCLRRAWNEKSRKHYTEIRVEDVREVTRAFHSASGVGGWRVAIVDAADELNRSSANALLKIIEEPPERAIFLLVAHRPARILPTIRSRCRKLALEALAPDEISAATRSLGAPWAELSDSEILRAAAAAQGSVRAALRLLDGEGSAFDATLHALFAALPRVDWPIVHALADRLTGRDNEEAFEGFVRALQGFLDARVRAGAVRGAAAVIGYAEAFDEISAAVRETEVFNFDKKALIVSIFARLERAGRG